MVEKFELDEILADDEAELESTDDALMVVPKKAAVDEAECC